MKHQLNAILGVGTIALVVVGELRASAELPSRATTGPANIVLKLSDLRSACLIRDGVVKYDPAANSPEALRQLQRHFDVVIGLLVVTTPESIETGSRVLKSRTMRTGQQESVRYGDSGC